MYVGSHIYINLQSEKRAVAIEFSANVRNLAQSWPTVREIIKGWSWATLITSLGPSAWSVEWDNYLKITFRMISYSSNMPWFYRVFWIKVTLFIILKKWSFKLWKWFQGSKSPKGFWVIAFSPQYFLEAMYVLIKLPLYSFDTWFLF